MLYVAGADRFLNAITGRAVTAGQNMAGKLFTADPPELSGGSANELSGNGYSDHDLAFADFSLSNQNTNTDRRLVFPSPMTFFDPAGTAAQTAEAFGFAHGTTLIWSKVGQLVPNRALGTVTNAWLQVPYVTNGLTLTQTALDRGLGAIAGQAYAATDVFWELHSGGANVVPAAGNRLTGGGIDAIPDVAWALSTVAGYRRLRQSAQLTFSANLSADTNAEPTKLALWLGRPEASGTLLAYRTVTPSQMTAAGSSVRIAADALYFEILMAGV